MLPENVFIGFLVIFALRVTDVSLGTIRTLFILQGRKMLAASVGFIEVTIFIFAIAQVVAHMAHWSLMLAYSGGFAVGTYVGLQLESLFAMGFVQVRIISPDKGKEIAQALWEKSFGATVVKGEGRRGVVDVIFSIVRRRNLRKCMQLATTIDDDCFVAISDSRSLLRGYLGSQARK